MILFILTENNDLPLAKQIGCHVCSFWFILNSVQFVWPLTTRLAYINWLCFFSNLSGALLSQTVQLFEFKRSSIQCNWFSTIWFALSSVLHHDQWSIANLLFWHLSAYYCPLLHKKTIGCVHASREPCQMLSRHLEFHLEFTNFFSPNSIKRCLTHV